MRGHRIKDTTVDLKDWTEKADAHNRVSVRDSVHTKRGWFGEPIHINVENRQGGRTFLKVVAVKRDAAFGEGMLCAFNMFGTGRSRLRLRGNAAVEAGLEEAWRSTGDSLKWAIREVKLGDRHDAHTERQLERLFDVNDYVTD